MSWLGVAPLKMLELQVSCIMAEQIARAVNDFVECLMKGAVSRSSLGLTE